MDLLRHRTKLRLRLSARQRKKTNPTAGKADAREGRKTRGLPKRWTGRGGKDGVKVKKASRCGGVALPREGGRESRSVQVVRREKRKSLQLPVSPGNCKGPRGITGGLRIHPPSPPCPVPTTGGKICLACVRRSTWPCHGVHASFRLAGIAGCQSIQV